MVLGYGANLGAMELGEERRGQCHQLLVVDAGGSQHNARRFVVLLQETTYLILYYRILSYLVLSDVILPYLFATPHGFQTRCRLKRHGEARSARDTKANHALRS